MVYKADISVINFLLTARNSSSQEELHEPSKRVGNYILIDYFDWLEYLNRVDKDTLWTTTLYEFRTVYNECKEVIKILKNKLSSDNISNILQVNKKILNQNIEKTQLEYLCQGYQLFVDEVQSLQTYLLSTFDYNNSTMPILLIPFSQGLNRLSTAHYNLIEEMGESGLPNVDSKKGLIKDNCTRSKIDFGIRTYTFFKLCGQKPYNLPECWQISKSYKDKDSNLIREKSRYVADCYSQYCYVGFIEGIEKEEEVKIKGTKLYKNVFYINFPFLLESMRLPQKIVENKDINKVMFIEG